MSSKKNKKYKIKIVWKDVGFKGMTEEYLGETKQRTYDFRTKQERDVFLEGVEQAIGWSDYEVVSDKAYDE